MARRTERPAPEVSSPARDASFAKDRSEDRLIKPILVHVGYHKTATTWLQGDVFRAEHGFNPVLSQEEIFAHLVTPHHLVFDKAAARDAVDARRNGGAAGTVDVVSLESLTANPFFGARESHDYALRLKEIAPDARILLTIREQTRIIASIYMQYLSRGGTEPPALFFAGASVGGYHGFDAAHYEYDRLVAHYQALFGASNVMVLPLEAIVRDQPSAIAALASFSGNRIIGKWTEKAPRGASYPETAAPLLRRINHFRATPLNRHPVVDLGALSDYGYRAAGGAMRRFAEKAKRPITDLSRSMFSGRFADSNRRLAAMLADDVDLTDYQGFENAPPR